MASFFQHYKISYSVYNNFFDKRHFEEQFSKNEFLYEFIQHFGGSVFEKGLFKIHTFDYIKKWTSFLSHFFEDTVNTSGLVCFASNWLGMMYCTDRQNEFIYQFDPVKHEIMSEKMSFENFFDIMLTDETLDILLKKSFREIVSCTKIIELDYMDSIRCRNGMDFTKLNDIDNIEIITTESLWNLQKQVFEKEKWTKELIIPQLR
jgi:hypothetical protein